MSEASQTAPSIDEFLGQDARPRWKRWARYWVPALILLVIVLVALRLGSGGGKVDYVSEEVTSGALDITVTATGNLRPTNQVEVGSEVSGRIDEIFVDVNDRVTRGQVIARINTDVIEDQIAQAQANLQAAQASVQQARASLALDQAQLARLQEVERLSGGKVPSRTELEIAEANVARDRAALASAQANVAAAKAQLSSAQTNLDRAIIVSPVSGVVLARQVEPGQTVAATFNTPTLFVIAEDLGQMQLRVSVDEADVGQVREGQEAHFTVDAYPGRQFPARVERIDLASTSTATAQAQSGQQSSAVVIYEARLAVENPEGLLRPGMTATATISAERTAEALLVPNGALRFRPPAADEGEGVQLGGPPQFGLEREEQRASIGVGSRQTVHVVEADGSLRQVVVVTGVSDGRQTVVTSDELQAGMKLATGVRAARP